MLLNCTLILCIILSNSYMSLYGIIKHKFDPSSGYSYGIGIRNCTFNTRVVEPNVKQ